MFSTTGPLTPAKKIRDNSQGIYPNVRDAMIDLAYLCKNMRYRAIERSLLFQINKLSKWATGPSSKYSRIRNLPRGLFLRPLTSEDDSERVRDDGFAQADPGRRVLFTRRLGQHLLQLQCGRCQTTVWSKGDNCIIRQIFNVTLEDNQSAKGKLALLQKQKLRKVEVTEAGFSVAIGKRGNGVCVTVLLLNQGCHETSISE